MGDFQYISVKTFAAGAFGDVILDSNKKGSVFVKLQVANYIFDLLSCVMFVFMIFFPFTRQQGVKEGTRVVY